MSDTDTTDLRRLAWADVLAEMAWEQGDHVTLIGPTKAGKTTAALSLLDERARRGGHILSIHTKPRGRDATLTAFRDRGYEEVREWPPPKRRKQIVLWPKLKALGNVAEQQTSVAEAFDGVFEDGSWCVYVDELFWITNRLGLDKPLRDLWLQGRALDITLVVSAQRPRNVPVEAYSSSAHLFVWRNNDDEDLKRVSELGGVSKKVIRDAAGELDWKAHECLWVDTRAGRLAVTQAPPAR